MNLTRSFGQQLSWVTLGRYVPAVERAAAFKFCSARHTHARRTPIDLMLGYKHTFVEVYIRPA